MRINLYVDGFNFYYRALKGNLGAKWLDLAKLASHLFPLHETVRIRYFTARVRPRPSNPDQPLRQAAYLRALETIPNLTIHFGHFAEHQERCRLVTPLRDGTRFVEVMKTSEKGSDVNLASYLLLDAIKDNYEGAAIITNDSDLCTPIQMVRDDLARKVLVYDPSQRPGESRELKRVSTVYRKMRSGVIRASQFPATLADAHGTITKPAQW